MLIFVVQTAQCVSMGEIQDKDKPSYTYILVPVSILDA